ncbi:solute carrier family 22 member 18-like [Littorina saxatilis]|uniref:Organic cation transporter-like protein 2 n=1 Tax=Littorina saxatilis TaxID=31220 RepID=A0AAN9ARK9_9CAEN
MSQRTGTRKADENDQHGGIPHLMNNSRDMNSHATDKNSDSESYDMDSHGKEDGGGAGVGKSSSDRRVIMCTHFNIFLYSTCFWIQTGTLPYLTKKLGADPVTFGYLQTTFAVVQLAGGPLFGRFGDIFGGRAAMTLAFVAAALSYALLGVSYSIPILFVSRLPSVFMHAMQGGQMIVTDIGDSSKRADALGKLGMSYGVGMVIGPFVGGIITKVFGEQFAAFVAAAGSLLSIVLVLQFVPPQTKKFTAPSKETQGSGSSGGTTLFSLKKWTSLVAAPGACFLLCVRFFAGIPIGVFQSMFQVVALETFKLAPDQNGYLMSFIGVTTMIVQGVGVGYVTKKFTESSTLVASSAILVFSYLLLAQVGSVFQLCLVCLPLVVGLTTQNVVVTSALTHTVTEEDTGAILGLNMAVNSLVRTFSPTVGGYLLESYGFPSFGYFGTVVSTVLTLVLFVRHQRKAL